MITTLGFGGDHDENMLKSISEAGSGTYYYITKNDEIPQAFSDCLGGLLSVTSQNIKLKFEVMKGVTLKAIHSNYKKLSTDQILLGDIYAEETKDVVIEVEIEKSQHDVDNFELVNFTLSYYNVLEKEPEDLEVTASVNRSNKSVPSTPNERLEQQKVRVQHAEALLQSKAAADKGDYETARTVLKCQIKREEESPFAKSNAYFGQLATEMNDMIHHFESPQIYREKGSKVLISKWSESNYQRSSEPTSEYATRKKRSVYSNYLSKAKK
ncbi:hypothetical protein AKO1_015660 [Acrasis kona]|uniref:Uncharacterized protein n=1 Tax=Acrasis kona TaxID=1008807 RepID=A0AAW2ZGG9_9EUKA